MGSASRWLYLRLLFALVPVPFPIDAFEGEPDAEIIRHGGRAPQVERERDVGFVEELDRDLPVFHNAAVRVAPPDRKRPLACRARIRAIEGRDQGITLQGVRRQNDFSGPAQVRAEHEQPTVQDDMAHRNLRFAVILAKTHGVSFASSCLCENMFFGDW